MARIGFVGIGTMGLHLAGHLVAGGHDVVACDADPAAAARLGTATAATPAEAAAQAELAILSLPTPAVVEEVVTGPAGVLEGMPAGGILVDMSTSPPALARRLHAACAQRGLDFLDAPVSGGPLGARDATLAIMVGGSEAAFDRCRPVLELLGSRVEHVGGPGAGQAVKLCNNLVVGATMAALCEACELLEREGIDPAQAYAVLTGSTSDSTVLRRRFPLAGVRPEHPASKGYEPLFRLDLLRKDLGLALDFARERGVSLPVTEAAAAEYDRALADGLGALDYSALYCSRPR